MAVSSYWLMRTNTGWARASRTLRTNTPPFTSILLPISDVTEMNAVVTGQQASPCLSTLLDWYSNCWVEAQVMVIGKLFKTLWNRFSQVAPLYNALLVLFMWNNKEQGYVRLLTGLWGNQRSRSQPLDPFEWGMIRDANCLACIAPWGQQGITREVWAVLWMDESLNRFEWR